MLKLDVIVIFSDQCTEELDNCLCQEILELDQDPFKYKKGSISRVQIWENVHVGYHGIR